MVPRPAGIRIFRAVVEQADGQMVDIGECRQARDDRACVHESAARAVVAQGREILVHFQPAQAERVEVAARLEIFEDDVPVYL